MSAKIRKHVFAEITKCVNLNADGEPCGREGQRGLPPGVCAEHGIAIYRAVRTLMEKGLPAA